MLSPAPLWKYRYTDSSSMQEKFLLLFTFLTLDYVAETHFCLNRRTGELLWEEPDYDKRSHFEVFGVYDNIIAARRIDVDQQRLGLWRIDLRSGEPIIPTYPDTFWGRIKQGRAEKHWWSIGDDFSVRGKINADGTLPTSAGLIDLKSLTKLNKKYYDFPSPKFPRIQRLFRKHSLDIAPLGILHHRVNTEPEDVKYDPNTWLDYTEIDQAFWLENDAGEALWNFDLAQATRDKRPKNVEIHLRLPYLLFLLYWPTELYKDPSEMWKDPKIYEPGTYQIWVLDLRTGEIVQRLKPIEEGFVGNMECDDAGLLFYANVRISGQHGCEFVYYHFSEAGEDAALDASEDR